MTLSSPLTDLRVGDEDPLDDYGSLLPYMDELGLLSDLEEELPPGFSAVFEIGRVLRDPKSKMSGLLSGALELSDVGLAEDILATTEPDLQPVEVPAGEQYEAEFIRTWSDVQYVYSWQHLLPEEEFLRRLGNRTLWFPMAKAVRVRAIESAGDDFNPSPSKQKVYVLLDTSASMALRHRFAFAKALVFRFLRQNGGSLSKRARSHEFASLTEEEAAAVEKIYRGEFGQNA